MTRVDSTSESMTELYTFLLREVFGGFLRGERAFLGAVDAFDGELRIEDDALIFTVPALFRFARGLSGARTGRARGAAWSPGARATCVFANCSTRTPRTAG